MTAAEPPRGDPAAADPAAAWAEDDSESCLCLVAGYAKTSGLIATVTSEAEKRIMRSPLLGDFLQLRYVDLGPPPGDVGDRSRPVRNLSAELMTAGGSAGRSHFALVVLASSATTIERLLASCAAEPFLAGLRIRFAGIAGQDDRAAGARVAGIVSSATGKWGAPGLVDALYRQCDELPRYFAARGEPGLTRLEVAALRRAHGARADVDRTGGTSDDGREAEADALGDPDLNAAPSGTPVVAGAVVRDGDAGARAGAGAATVAAETAVAAEAAQSPGGRRAGPAVSRWLPALPWRGGQQQPDPAAQPVPAPATAGLVYLLVVGEPDSADDPALGRLQEALVELDKRLASQRVCAYRVRLVHGHDSALRGELRDAGALRRRAARRSARADDFGALLTGVLASLRRDGAQLEAVARAAGQAVTRPVVVIFTTDPPMADRSSAAAFGDLAAAAAVVWVVPANSQGLVSPTFASRPTVAVIGEHPAVAEDIWDLLSAAGAYAQA